jgi:hypothetical protein
MLQGLASSVSVEHDLELDQYDRMSPYCVSSGDRLEAFLELAFVSDENG